MRVETHSGYKADEYPVRFWLGTQKFEVIEIEDRWYGPGISYYKVFADNAQHYILEHVIENDQWSIQLL